MYNSNGGLCLVRKSISPQSSKTQHVGDLIDKVGYINNHFNQRMHILESVLAALWLFVQHFILNVIG